MNKKKTEKTGTVRIRPETLKLVKEACLYSETKIKDFVDAAVLERANKELRKKHASI